MHNFLWLIIFFLLKCEHHFQSFAKASMFLKVVLTCHFIGVRDTVSAQGSLAQRIMGLQDWLAIAKALHIFSVYA